MIRSTGGMMLLVRTVLDGEVRVHYGQMYLESDDDPPWAEMEMCFAGQRNGLAGAAVPGSVWLTTGLHTGDVGLRVEVHGSAPAVGDGWEEAVEVPFLPGSRSPALVGWGGEWTQPVPLSPGPHRLRWCAAGMDAGRALDTRIDGPPADRYLLQLWPAAPAPDEVVRETSEIAAYWHGHARSLPSAEELARRRAIACRSAAAPRPPSADAAHAALIGENLRQQGRQRE